MAAGRPGGARSRRVSLPGVAELLRPAQRSPAQLRPAGPGSTAAAERPASGREQHAQKITVYLSGAELLDLERARLTLRTLGLPADRGRIVREALAVMLADLDAAGAQSLVATRLREAGLRE